MSNTDDELDKFRPTEFMVNTHRELKKLAEDDELDKIEEKYTIAITSKDGVKSFDERVMDMFNFKQAILKNYRHIDDIGSIENPGRYDKLGKHQAKILLDYHEDCLNKLRQALNIGDK